MRRVHLSTNQDGTLTVTDATTGDLLPATGIALEADAPGPGQHVGLAITMSGPRTLIDVEADAELVYDRGESDDVDAADLPPQLLEILDAADVAPCSGDHERFGCERERLILAYKLGALGAQR